MIDPYYQDDFVTIYHGDCRVVIPTIGKVCSVVTSPPYNLNTRINGKRRYVSRQIKSEEFSTKYGASYHDNLDPVEYQKFTERVLEQCLVCSSKVFWNVLLATGNKVPVFKMMGRFAENLKEVAVWDKGHAQPAMKEKTMNSVFELVLVFDTEDPLTRQFGSAVFGRGCCDNIWRVRPGRSVSKTHKATFPEELVYRCLELHQSKLVLDPFMGTGTTLRAAKNKGIQSVGIDIEESFCEIAAMRAAEGSSDPPLIGSEKVNKTRKGFGLI